MGIICKLTTVVSNISLFPLVLLDTLQLATCLFSQGATAVVHGCSVYALGPSGESSHTAAGGGNQYPSVSITQILELSTLWTTLMKGHKQGAFHARFIEKLALEVGVVSQQYNGMQCTSPNTGL